MSWLYFSDKHIFSSEVVVTFPKLNKVRTFVHVWMRVSGTRTVQVYNPTSPATCCRLPPGKCTGSPRVCRGSRPAWLNNWTCWGTWRPLDGVRSLRCCVIRCPVCCTTCAPLDHRWGATAEWTDWSVIESIQHFGRIDCNHAWTIPLQFTDTIVYKQSVSAAFCCSAWS